MPPAAVGPALRLDLRDRARVDARLREEPLDERGRVGAVGVDDHEPVRTHTLFSLRKSGTGQRPRPPGRNTGNRGRGRGRSRLWARAEQPHLLGSRMGPCLHPHYPPHFTNRHKEPDSLQVRSASDPDDRTRIIMLAVGYRTTWGERSGIRWSYRAEVCVGHCVACVQQSCSAYGTWDDVTDSGSPD